MSFTDEQVKILEHCKVSKEEYEECYFTEYNMLFRPIENRNGEEVYKEWLENKNRESGQTTQEKMLKQIADLKIDNMKKDTLINNTLKTIAELKVKVMSMEGGN